MILKNRFAKLMRFAGVLIAGGLFSAPSYALTTSFTVSELNGFLKAYRTSSDPRKLLLWTDLQKKLADDGISLTDSGIRVTGTVISDGQSSDILSCDDIQSIYFTPSTTVTLGSLSMAVPPIPTLPTFPPVGPVSGSYQNIPWAATLDGTETGISFGYASGSLVFDAKLNGAVSAGVTGTFNWKYGWWAPKTSWECDPLGIVCGDVLVPGTKWKCEPLPDEHWSADLNGTASAHLVTSMSVSFDASTNVLRVGIPDVSVLASLGNVKVSVNTTFQPQAKLWTKLGVALPSPIMDKINSKIAEVATAKAANFRDKFQGKYTGEYDLSQILDPIQMKLLGEALNSPFLQVYIEDHAQELLFYMLIGDKEAISQSFASTAACNAVASLRGMGSNTAILPFSLYTKNADGVCVAAVPEGDNQSAYFTDNGCASSIDFQPTPLSAWCTEVLGANFTTTLGNAAAWEPNANPPIPNVRSQKWTIPQGTQMPITSEPIAGNTTPFMKRVDYRDVLRPRSHTVYLGPAIPPLIVNDPPAICSLEMRIYTKNVNATNLIPLMAIHGGSWQYRGAGFVGMEAQISHYTDAGFVVFAPFYLLAGTADGNAECNGATSAEMVADIEAALTWVKTNGATFGAKPGKISLMGQSAGAHLAGWLVTHRPNDVERAVLLYPPTDVNDFMAHARAGDIYEPFISSLDILSAYLGPLATVPQATLNENSYRDKVASANGQMPPVFLIHGRTDKIVPSNQSVILCNAYGGNAVNTGGGTALRATYNCGKNGRLHLFEEAQHGLDACVTTRGLSGMCLAGSEASRSLVASSLRQARGWLKGDEFGWLVPIINLLLD